VLGLYEGILHEIIWVEKTGKYEIHYTKGEKPTGNNPDQDLIFLHAFKKF
jgi:hypothetical protein